MERERDCSLHIFFRHPWKGVPCHFILTQRLEEKLHTAVSNTDATRTLTERREEREERATSGEARGHSQQRRGRLAFSVNGGVIMGHFAKKN